MIEYRQVAETSVDGDTLIGLVTPFDTETVIGDMKRGGFKEKVNRVAFDDTLRDEDVVLLHNHDTGLALARTSIPAGEGSLNLNPDPSAGLRAKAIPLDCDTGRMVLRGASKGIYKGMSFGFEVLEDRWTDDQGRASDPARGTHRELMKVRLREVTTTAFPAYATTELSARDAVTAAREKRAAAASYADLDTCGECGSTSEYGSYCSGCGGSMTPASSKGTFCTSCGQGIDDASRGSHVCQTRDDQAVASVDAAIDEALKLLGTCNRDDLPPEVNQAIDLLHGAQTSIGAHMSETGIPDPDKPNGNTYGDGDDSDDDDNERVQDIALSIRIYMESV